MDMPKPYGFTYHSGWHESTVSWLVTIMWGKGKSRYTASNLFDDMYFNKPNIDSMIEQVLKDWWRKRGAM